MAGRSVPCPPRSSNGQFPFRYGLRQVALADACHPPCCFASRYRAGAKEPAAPIHEVQPRPDAPAQDRHAQSMFGSSTWYAGRERGTKLSQSRVLTEREMEMIELGGAPP
jgi:hypothetical protein